MDANFLFLFEHRGRERGGREGRRIGGGNVMKGGCSILPESSFQIPSHGITPTRSWSLVQWTAFFRPGSNYWLVMNSNCGHYRQVAGLSQTVLVQLEPALVTTDVNSDH